MLAYIFYELGTPLKRNNDIRLVFFINTNYVFSCFYAFSLLYMLIQCRTVGTGVTADSLLAIRFQFAARLDITEKL